MTSDVRSFDSVVVVGAGISAFGYPMTLQLPALLWQAIGESEAAVGELRRRAGRGGTPKEILGTDPATVALGWQLARDLPEVRDAFQRTFANLDADRDPSPAHRDLARLIHHGRVHFVISYNWDTCLERAYQALYGTALPPSILVKPHGDVLARDLSWTFPDEAGLVPQPILERLVELDDRPRTLLVLGYSGSDEHVVETLLRPLKNKWPVYEISPSAAGPDAVPATADDALAEVAGRLVPPMGSTGWRYVVFDRSRGFEAALRGERLRPVDVHICPELPYAKKLAERLTSSRIATLAGGSGTGKSVTAFQAAKRLNKDGWAVVELARPGVAGEKEVAAFSALPTPVLAIVDDAQALDPTVVADLEAAIDDGRALLLVSTERLETRDDETVSDAIAKDFVYQHCLDHIEEIEPMLTALDDRVGRGMLRESARARLEAAKVSSRDPWSFMFVASGGERRISEILDQLAETPEAALLLGAVAVGQITSLDAGVTHEQVASDVVQVAPDAFGTGAMPDGKRFSDVTSTVQAERLVRDSSGRLRTPHIRVADRALMGLARRDDAVGSGVRAIVRSHLSNPDVAIRGKYWVLNSFTRSDSLRYRWREEWLDAATIDSLVGQCSTIGTGTDRSAAALALSELSFADVLERRHWEIVATQVVNWLPTLDSSEVYGLRRLMMHLRGSAEDLCENVKTSLPAADLAGMLSARGTRPSASSWADLIRELSPKWDSNEREAWAAAFADGVDVDALDNWLRDTTPESHNDEITDLVDVLAGIAPAVAECVLRACAPHMRSSFEADMASAAHGFTRWVFGNMSLVAHLAPADGALALRRARRPSDALVSGGQSEVDPDDPLVNDDGDRWDPPQDFVDLSVAVLDVMRQVDWTAAGQTLNGKTLPELEYLDTFLAWIAWLSTELLDLWADAISFEWLDQLAFESVTSSASGRVLDTAQSDDAPVVTDVGPVSRILSVMAEGDRGNQRARAYLMERITTLQHLPSNLVLDLPDVAVALAQRGGRVEMMAPRGRGWEPVVRASSALRQLDPGVAQRVLFEAADELLPALQAPQSNDMHGLAQFIEVADAFSATHLDEMLIGLDAHQCESVWSKRLDDAGDDARALVERAARVQGSVGDVARRLLSS